MSFRAPVWLQQCAYRHGPCQYCNYQGLIPTHEYHTHVYVEGIPSAILGPHGVQFPSRYIIAPRGYCSTIELKCLPQVCCSCTACQIWCDGGSNSAPGTVTPGGNYTPIVGTPGHMHTIEYPRCTYPVFGKVRKAMQLWLYIL